MLAHKEGLFLALKETLVQHVGTVSSQNNSFWRNGRFVDDSYALLQPAAQLPSSASQV